MHTYLSSIDHLVFKLPYHILFNNLDDYLTVQFEELPIQLEEFLFNIFDEELRVLYSPKFDKNPFTYKKDLNFYPTSEGNPGRRYLRRYGAIKYIVHTSNPRIELSTGKYKPLPMLEFTFSGELLENRQSSLPKIIKVLDSVQHSTIKEVDIAFDFPISIDKFKPTSIYEQDLINEQLYNKPFFKLNRTKTNIKLNHYKNTNSFTLYVNYDPSDRNRNQQYALRCYTKYEISAHRVELMLSSRKKQIYLSVLEQANHARTLFDAYPNLAEFLSVPCREQGLL